MWELQQCTHGVSIASGSDKRGRLLPCGEFATLRGIGSARRMGPSVPHHAPWEPGVVTVLRTSLKGCARQCETGEQDGSHSSQTTVEDDSVHRGKEPTVGSVPFDPPDPHREFLLPCPRSLSGGGGKGWS